MAADQPRMAEKLQEANTLLEDIQRGLNDYLEKKRLFFPRYPLLCLGSSGPSDPCRGRREGSRCELASVPCALQGSHP